MFRDKWKVEKLDALPGLCAKSERLDFDDEDHFTKPGSNFSFTKSDFLALKKMEAVLHNMKSLEIELHNLNAGLPGNHHDFARLDQSVSEFRRKFGPAIERLVSLCKSAETSAQHLMHS